MPKINRSKVRIALDANAKALLVLCMAFGISQPALAADFAPMSLGHDGLLQESHHSLSYGYEKRAGLGLNPATDVPGQRAVIEENRLALAVAFKGQWHLAVAVRGVASKSHWGYDKGFGGVGLLLEKRRSYGKNIQIGLGAFADSGTNEMDPAKSIAREKDTTGGFVVRGLFRLQNLDLGMDLGRRYRTAIALGDYELRHELFYSGNARLMLLANFGLTVGVAGRQIQFRDPFDPRATDTYSIRKSHGATLGVATTFAGWTAEIYGGRGDKFGSGRKIIGASLTMALGQAPKSPRQAAAVKQAKPHKAATAKLMPHDRGSPAPTALGQQMVDDADNAPAPKAIGTVMDDFSLVDRRLEKSQLKDHLATADEYANREIEALKRQEAKQARLRAAQTRTTEQLRLRDQGLQEQIERERSEERRLRQEVRPQLEAMPYVTDYEASWQGLD